MLDRIRHFHTLTRWAGIVALLALTIPAAHAGLNDTGITTCSNADTNGLPCPVAGFPGQDAEFRTPMTSVAVTQTFPLKDQIDFAGQFLDELFVLSDGSMWIIKGVSDGYSTGSGENDFTIYSGTDALPNPSSGYGTKTDYFMLIKGNSTTYFVDPLPPQTLIVTDQIDFSGQYLGELFVLSDGSMWVIKGASSWDSTGSGEKDFTIYSGTDALPAPRSSYGVKSDYFMLIKGNSTTYFVDPLIKPEYKNLSVIKVGNGLVVSKDGKINCGSICSGYFDNGTSVILTATPDTSSGSIFSGWSGACTNKTGDCTVKMSDAQTVTATFIPKPITYSLSITKSGNGTVTSVPAGINCGTTCSKAFTSGTAVTLTAKADTGATFTKWTGCTPVATKPLQCTVTLTSNKTVMAAFSSGAVTTATADVVVTAMTLTPASPAANSTFSAKITVKNQGTVIATDSYLDVWANQSAEQICGAFGEQWIEIGSLAVGATKTLTVNLRSMDAGTKTLRAFADSWCEISESNEVNNQMTQKYTVK
jgi:hypothetical protein